MDTFRRANIRLIITLGILLGSLVIIWPASAFPPAEIVVPGGAFNLTATVSETYIYWTFDNDTYNITIDDTVNATAFTGEAYLLTNLRRSTRHMMIISNDTTTYVDYQTTLSSFWDTDFFLFYALSVFFAIIGLGRRIPIFLMISWFMLVYDIWLAWNYYGISFEVPILLATFTLVGVSFVWYAQS